MNTKWREDRPYRVYFDDYRLEYHLHPQTALNVPICIADSPALLARCARKADITYDQIENAIPSAPRALAFEQAMTGPYQMTSAELLQHLHNVLTELQRQQREEQYSRGGDVFEALTCRCRAEGLEWALQEIGKLQED